ncbi:MAG: AAA family ATPase [Algoriphagus aquaeductus]|uniref:AAA family ATPase n=1 Tax=Algoriphagus aquaeductus TaxID=475299 RepID=UPI00387955C1
MPTKEEIYSQIQEFVTQPSTPGVKNSPTFERSYLFVPSAIAKERAAFFRFIISQEDLLDLLPEKWKALDLAFGSGNLTAHLLQESEYPIEKIVLNDKNTAVTNQNLSSLLPNTQISAHDFLESAQFPVERFNLVIFNPQTGGGWSEGSSNLSDQKPILHDGDLKSYLESIGRETSELTFSVDEAAKQVKVHSDSLNKGPMRDLVGDIKIFNYYDVFWTSKTSKLEGEQSNNVKFRQTFDKVFDPNGLLVYYGDESYFQAIFADFPYVIQLCPPDDGKMLFVATKAISEEKTILYRKSGPGTYEVTDSCKEVGGTKEESDLDELEVDLDHSADDFLIGKGNSEGERQETPNPEGMKFTISEEELGSLDFPYLNVLLKGVPGTGKSRLIDQWIISQLDLKRANHPNVLRINVHSASSNADLMQGIGIAANGGQVEYHEKTGLVLNHLKNACAKPKQPFVLVLEEIQENSLNELIGDLIYLIEDSKRVDLSAEVGGEFESFEDFVGKLVEKKPNVEFVQVPYLVNTETKFRNLIFPKNLYVFCTSNYRDDKKVVEDNLMRRFDLIELYPKYEDAIFKKKEVTLFLKTLNEEIIKGFESREIHPDRLIIGHANWLKVEDGKSFCRAMLKAIVEFKDIREIEWSEMSPVLQKITVLPFGLDSNQILKAKNYKDLIEHLQKQAFDDLLND